MPNLVSTPIKFKKVLTVPVAPDVTMRCEYVFQETRTIVPDRFYSMEWEAIEADLAHEQLGVGPTIWASLTDYDRKQLCDLITEAA